MSSIFASRSKFWKTLFFTLCVSGFFPLHVFAQEEESLSITLTPPLFQVTQAPGGTWSSILRVVNTNKFDLSVSVSVRDFRPDGESGNVLLGEQGSPEDTHLMSGWFILPHEDIHIPRGSTGEIPFTISVPPNADPGGHYAAVIVATRPGTLSGGSGAGISSAVTSLFFLRVPGDVFEEGAIRDFHSEQTFLSSPETKFLLRFENTGNVHLVPEGSIVITNMWGKERGKIDINKVNTFGNVLPGSTRKFEFSWKGESNPFEFGRYKALATLVYGEDGRKTIYRTTYFWVVPIMQVVPFFAGLFLFGWFVTWAIRRYVRKALMLERERLGLPESTSHSLPETQKQSVVAPRITLAVLRRPLEEPSTLNLSALTAAKQDASKMEPSHMEVKSWLRRNRRIVGFLLIFMLGCGLISWYFVEVFQSERAYSMEQVKDH